MKYDANITYVKFGKQLLYGVLAFALSFIGEFLYTMPPEVQTIEIVFLIGLIRALDNVAKHY